MIEQLKGVNHLTPIGDIFDTEHGVETFESSTPLREVLAYVSAKTPDAVILTEEGIACGIMTLKDIIRTLQNWENLNLPVKEFMTSPLLTFQATQQISEVLDAMLDAPYNKIVVLNEKKVVGMADRRHLLSLCYTQMNPLIKHEYNVFHSILAMAAEGESGLIKLATTDSLTGIGNRRLFEEIYQAHQALGKRYDVSMFLMMFDIDDFKKINDSFGHNVGDSVLKELALLVSHSIRQSDVFIRWGGDEFAILLRYSDPEKVIRTAKQICDRINTYLFDTIGHVTCSFGLTPIRPDEKLEEAVARADNALYHAKSEGKNTVHIEMV